ncbi:MAG: polysaccharide export protein [Acidobacteriia bacterium]|nr:polysaccharide export protein [Terriglobia bacterium]
MLRLTFQGNTESTPRFILFYFALLAALGLIVLLVPQRARAQDSDSSEPASVGGEQDSPDAQSASPAEGGETADPDIVSNQNWGPAAGLGPDYVLGAGDVLMVDVFNVKDLTHLRRRVGNDGSVSLPLLGQVKVAGLSTQQAQKKLEDLWGESYLEDPQVSVFVTQFKARPVSVIGAVAKPGLYPLTARRTLIDVLSMAGGLGTKTSSVAPGRSVIVTRKGGFGDLPMTTGMQLLSPDKLEIELTRLLYSSDDSVNIEIKPLDVVSVTKAPVIYVVGEVKKAGGFVLQDREKVTVLQALALAEGLHGNPAKKGARIIRSEANGQRQEIPINLGRIMRGKDPDVDLSANDILFVPQSMSKAALKQASSSVVATISGLIIWGKF